MMGKCSNHIRLIVFVIFVICLFSSHLNGRIIEKKRNQKKEHNPTGKNDKQAANDHTSSTSISVDEIEDSKSVIYVKEQAHITGCLPCKHDTDILQESLYSYWLNDFESSFGCACHTLHSLKSSEVQSHALIESLLYSITQSKEFSTTESDIFLYKTIPKREALHIITNWELLGPIPVGKLEVDGDPTFQAYYDEPIQMQGKGIV